MCEVWKLKTHENDIGCLLKNIIAYFVHGENEWMSESVCSDVGQAASAHWLGTGAAAMESFLDGLVINIYVQIL